MNNSPEELLGGYLAVSELASVARLRDFVLAELAMLGNGRESNICAQRARLVKEHVIGIKGGLCERCLLAYQLVPVPYRPPGRLRWETRLESNLDFHHHDPFFDRISRWRLGRLVCPAIQGVDANRERQKSFLLEWELHAVTQGELLCVPCYHKTHKQNDNGARPASRPLEAEQYGWKRSRPGPEA